MFKKTSIALRGNEEKVVFASLVLFSVLLVVKYFSGLENSDYYSGLTLKFLNPDLFQNDPVLGNLFSDKSAPYKMTAFVFFPMLFGEAWLDDRLAVIIYLLSVLATFIAADRIAVLLGAQGITERLIVQLMFLKDHKIIANMVLFAYHSDFNHSALSYPFALWILYIALAQYRIWWVLLLATVLTVISPQVGPFIMLAGLLIVAVTGREQERKIAIGLICAGFIAAYVVLLHMVDVREADRLYIWERLTTSWYKNMGNPFNTVRDGFGMTVAGNVVWVGLFLLAFAAARFWPAGQTRAIRGSAAIFTLSLIVWLIAGLYITFAPDVAKMPQFLLFPFARQLQFTQILAYLFLMVGLLQWARTSRVGGLLLLPGFFILLLIGPGNYGLWTTLFAGALVGAVVVCWSLRRGTAFAGSDYFQSGPGLWKSLLFLSMAGVFAVAMPYAAWQKSADWIFLFKNGIHGFSTNVRWIGVDKYFRDNTPKDAVVLPLSFFDRGAPRKVLIPRRHLASRSGRAVAVPFLLAHGLDGDFFRFTNTYRPLGLEIGTAWTAGNVKSVTQKVNAMKPRIDYIVVPIHVRDRIVSADFPFAQEAVVGAYSILSRTKNRK